MVEVRVEDNGKPRRLIFSGDIGQWNKPIVRDPSVFTEADFVVMESTYGDRNHLDRGDIQTQLAEVINRTIGGGGNVVIPTFAVERAQELIYHLSQLLRENRIYEVPVFLDSPMAADVTDVFRQHRDYFDEEAWNIIAAGESPLRFPELSMPRTVEESKGINRLKQPAIIMATSGMCTAGRIKHHLVHNISRPESTVLFVGYQARGTLGRQILDGAEEVRIHGRHWRVKARIEQIHGFSGHADRNGLLRWLGALKSAPRQLILTHGEEEATLSLAEHVRRNMDWPVTVPEYQQTVTLE
jgi:metallo-beta-lactamase family protein